VFYAYLRFAKPQTIIQVGAFTGDDELIEACRRFGHRLYMFEPNPTRVEELRAKTNGAATIEVIPAAVSEHDGTATLNIAAHDDCSSLQEFDEKANSTWVHDWHPYRRFETVDRVEVPVTRLDTFLGARGIATVDLLEVDAQGEDLRVVASLGDRIADVKKIQIEVNIHTAPLYRNSFRLKDAMDFFRARGFERHVYWTQSLNREVNIIFRNQRFYPRTTVHVLSSAVEQQARTAYYASLKLPGVVRVTKMMLRRKLGGVGR
jgi:FkbM family methyltransferase